MKKYIIAALLVSMNAFSDSSSLNLALPNSPSSYASDQFRAGQLDCRQAIGASTNVEFGVVGVLNDQQQTLINPYGNQGKDVGVYARITIPIGAPKERMNCNVLFKLEMEKRALEVAKLKAEVAELRLLQTKRAMGFED